MSDAVFAVDRVSKRFGRTQALREMSLAFHAGEIHALCGHNGAGKSTVVKMLAGTEHPDSGTVRVDGSPVHFRGARDAERAGVAYVQQELSVLPTLSVEENVLLRSEHDSFLGTVRRHRQVARSLLDRVGLHDIDVRRAAGTLSAGEQQLVEIARAVGRNARLMILDEPTATLSDVEIERVFQVIRRLADAGTSTVFVSHRLGEVFELAHRVSVMRDGALVTSAPTSELTRSSLVHLMVGSVATESTVDVASLTADTPVGLRIRGLTVPGRVRDFSLTARAGEIVALAGQIGAGATEVMRALAGLEPTATGSIELHGRSVDPASPGAALANRIHYVSNDRKSEGLFLMHSASSNLTATRLAALSRGGFLSSHRSVQTIARLASRIGFDRRRLALPMDKFSGGNQQKVFVGRVLERADPGLVLLDEPTRGVDVRGRADIHTLVRAAAQQGNPVLFASTELDEILDLAHTVIIMRAGRIVGQRPRGELDSYAILRGITHSDENDELPRELTT